MNLLCIQKPDLQPNIPNWCSIHIQVKRRAMQGLQRYHFLHRAHMDRRERDTRNTPARTPPPSQLAAQNHH